MKLTPYIEGKDKPKRKADYSRLVGGSFNKQGHLHSRLVLGGYKSSSSLHLPTRTTLKVCTEAFIGFSMYTVQMVITAHVSLMAGSLKISVSVETNSGHNEHPKVRGGVRSF